jgi:glucose-1-phosphate cytidylyltransferase
VEIGGEPIVWHVMRIYAAQGFRRFTLCTGYKGELIEAAVHSRSWPEGVEVRCIDTGIETPTGGRIAKVGPLLEGRPFCATYADGVADIDLGRLVAFHREHGGLATMTVVRPELQFGVAEVDGDGRVRGFREKPRSEHWVNGGFFCFEPGALECMDEDSVLEREPLESLAARGQLHAFRHEGFWDCMDTYKDAVLLDDLWSRGEAPWKIWG